MAFPVPSAQRDTDFATSVTSMPVNMACPIFFDTFTGSSGTLLDAHTPDIGTSWTKLLNTGTGDIGLSSNAADANVAGYSTSEGGLYTADATYPSADYGATCTVVDGDTQDDTCTLAVRIQDADNMYAVQFNVDASQLYKKVATTWSTVGTAGAGVANGSRVTLKIVGTTLSFIDDGSTILSETVSDFSAAGKAGLGFGAVMVATDDSSTQALDNFTVTPVGELSLALVHVRNAGTWTEPTGYDQITDLTQAGGGAVGKLDGFYKITDGTELGIETWTASVGTSGAWQSIRITDWHGTTPPESDTASGDATSADPPTLSPSWGSDDTLWIAVAGHSAVSAAAFTAAPTNYTDFANNGASSGGAAVSIASSYRELAASSEDPGTFTAGGSNRFWASATIAIRPAAGGAPPATRRYSLGTLGVG